MSRDGNGVQIGNRWVGGGAPCLIIAEAGSNHNGHLTQALALVDIAARSGADAVKFQVFRASRLYPKKAGASDYLKLATPIYDIIQEMEMPYGWLPDLASACRQKGILFLASVFDEESVSRLDPYVEAFKIASYEMTHIPLVRYVAEVGKPVVISTGTATMEEVAETVNEFRSAGGRNLILMQCTAAYPAPLESLNLEVIPALKRRFGVPVGLSDHSRDPLVGPVAAVALGADLIEKHFTMSNKLPGPDHRFAVEPHELELMVRKVRETEQALGNGEKSVHPVEEELRAFARRSIFALRDILQGETFTTENVAVLRCGRLQPGLPPRRLSDVLGRRARQPIPEDTAIMEENLG